jgi:hypothetical protein
MNIAATATAMMPVAIHPSHFRRRVTTKGPITSARAAISIMTAMLGTETTPLIAAL